MAVLLAATLLLAAAGAAGEGCPSCNVARETNGWCETCGVGWVGDVALPSRHLWHVLDAHGHRLNLANLGCDGCYAALETDGYCADSKLGFVDREAYFSRLTWQLARSGRRTEPAPRCAACPAEGWCEACGVGRIGRFVVDDLEGYRNLVHDLEILTRAAGVAERCERCAVAMVTGTECPVCRIRYADGKPVEAGPAAVP